MTNSDVARGQMHELLQKLAAGTRLEHSSSGYRFADRSGEYPEALVRGMNHKFVEIGDEGVAITALGEQAAEHPQMLRQDRRRRERRRQDRRQRGRRERDAVQL